MTLSIFIVLRVLFDLAMFEIQASSEGIVRRKKKDKNEY